MPQPRKSTAVKKAQGTLQKCRENRAQMTVNGELPIQPPPGLTPGARAAWMMAVECAPKGLLTALDHSVLERWCRNYDICRKLTTDVDKNGAVDEEGNERGAFKALMRVQQVLAKCEEQLGFTPISRQRLQISQEETKEENEFAKFQRQRLSSNC